MKVCCYPTPGKRKSRLICEAFVQGCASGRLILDNQLHDGDAFFYGVTFDTEHIYTAVLADAARSLYFCDNSYFDSTRQTHFRITRNLLQHNGLGTSDCKRFDALGIPIMPWREKGKHIVVVEQSSSFMQMPAGYGGNWLDDLLPQLRRLTSREIRVRKWDANKGKMAGSLATDLVNAHALVAWSSAALITALASGIPVVALGQSAACSMSGSLLDLENLPTPDSRHNLFGLLADHQFTLDEMSSGYAWEQLRGDKGMVRD